MEIKKRQKTTEERKRCEPPPCPVKDPNGIFDKGLFGRKESSQLELAGDLAYAIAGLANKLKSLRIRSLPGS
jgi:hypothetical protein